MCVGDAAIAIGMRFFADTTYNNASETLHAYSKSPLFEGLNARQTIHRHKGPFQLSSFALPNWCHEQSPSEPNCYTDGTVKHPRFADYGLSGAGIWWPKRTIGAKELHTNEAECRHLETSGGLKVWGALFGPFVSSTRAELAGALLALSADGPVHIASDSANVVRQVKAILADTNYKPSKPWELTTDGDLWAIFHQHALAKGLHSIDITKVKGHATDKQVVDGKVRQVDKEGNDMSDVIADLGVGLHTEPILNIACVYTRRNIVFANLVTQIHIHNIAVLRNDKVLRDTEARFRNGILIPRNEKDKLKPATFSISSQCYAHPSIEGRKLAIRSPRIVSRLGRHESYKQMWAFLNMLRLKPRAIDEQGTSWLELFAFYEGVGGTLDPGQRSNLNKAAIKDSLRKCLAIFKKTVPTCCGYRFATL